MDTASLKNNGNLIVGKPSYPDFTVVHSRGLDWSDASGWLGGFTILYKRLTIQKYDLDI